MIHPYTLLTLALLDISSSIAAEKPNIILILADDPAETRNLEKDKPKKIAELAEDLAEAFHRGRTTPGPDQANDGWPLTRRDQKHLGETFPRLLPPEAGN